MLDRGRTALDHTASGCRQVERLEDLRRPSLRLAPAARSWRSRRAIEAFGAVTLLLDLDLVELPHDAVAVQHPDAVVDDLGLVALRAHVHGAAERVELGDRLQRAPRSTRSGAV